ncbi:CBS domain-containing protein [Aromatoleum toluolicum]|uniref:CBS domain-containing protein n=2 Tax=Aromatoleum TaxID=551759 RepID=A0ABX1NFT7_9RHOO|nr:CBS domain-containing protein [Aromatoleum toluolicum]NMF98137.1 CBS domain-containing protein [Aromatoleum toluolicum]
MNREFEPLPQARLAGLHCEVARTDASRRVSASSPAVEVMTDFTRVPAATISGETPLDDANRAMLLRGVRLLLVSDARHLVRGVITVADLLGERPVHTARDRGVTLGELTVDSVMTPLEKTEAVELGEIMRADVGHIVATLRRSGRQHLLVLEREEGGRGLIRGIFSASQIARQLGEPQPMITEIARTFAEIEAAIAA